MDFGLIVDLETTGTDPMQDRIIEIGLLEFALEEGQEPVVTRMYGAVQDPGIPLSEEIKKLTGLDDIYLAGQAIDWDIVQGYFGRASIVLAHNAGFDRAFLLKRSELAITHMHWGCSMRHVDWKSHGFRTRALNYLAADQGFINPFAHRALFDCATTLRIVAPFLQELVARSFMREYRISATGAPYDLKDRLKQNSYRWDAEKRVWYKELFEDGLDGEKEFLRQQIYQGQERWRIEEISLNDGAPGEKEA